eukprot:scaffold32257_cov56-Phaeocystis_antarctica.AAC.8
MVHALYWNSLLSTGRVQPRHRAPHPRRLRPCRITRGVQRASRIQRFLHAHEILLELRRHRLQQRTAIEAGIRAQRLARWHRNGHRHGGRRAARRAARATERCRRAAATLHPHPG